MGKEKLRFMVENKCNACGNHVDEMFTLGELYISNFIPSNSHSVNYPKADLTMMLCEKCGASQLKTPINPDILYKDKYWYYSSVNLTMRQALKDIAESCLSATPYNDNDIFLDIAGNDATLLQNIPSNLTSISIDPADEDIMKIARMNADIVINDYFSANLYKDNMDKKAKFITCIAMFYQLSNPHEFLDGVYDILDDNGLFVMQLSYTPLMIQQLEFGNIVSEHVMYYNLTSLKRLVESRGFSVVDCTLNDINGGSFRIYCTKENSNHFRTQQQRDVGKVRVNSLLSWESQQNWKQEWSNFWDKINQLKQQVCSFIQDKRLNGSSVAAIGASTKSSTLLQFFGLDYTSIDYIVDRNPIKHGLKTVGTDIPIISEDEFRGKQPDYALLLVWHFVKELIQREHDFIQKGGKFIVPMPEFAIYPENI